MIFNFAKFFITLLVGTRKNTIVHIVGFYGSMVYWEYLLVASAKLLGYNIVYEMRGGGADNYYKNGTKFYKWCFIGIIDKTVSIFSQGKENYPLIYSLSPDQDIFYYPNYIMPEFMPEYLPHKASDKVNCIFFGRLTRKKHIELIIQIISLVKSKISRPIKLTLIGNFEDKTYEEEILNLIKSENLKESVEILPQCRHEQLPNHLLNQHFYIFPTTEPREGHSNSLTEAMAYGIIPLATDHGFNRSVISCDTLIVESLTPIDFAKKLVSIIESDSLSKLSEQMYFKVKELYSYDNSSRRFMQKYSELFQNL